MNTQVRIVRTESTLGIERRFCGEDRWRLVDVYDLHDSNAYMLALHQLEALVKLSGGSVELSIG